MARNDIKTQASSPQTARKNALAEELSSDGQTALTPGQTMETLGRQLPPILILLASLAVFLPVLQNDFVDWDDKTLVNNPDYRGLGWAELRWMFAEFHFGQYQPLAWISLGLDHILWRADPFGYHWTSLVLHTTNALLFYFITLRLFGLSELGTAAPNPQLLRTAAGLAALIFAIHPLRVEPVAWASARGVLVAGLFFLSSLQCYLRAVLAEEDERRFVWMAVSVWAYLASLLSHPSGIGLPLVLLLIDVYCVRRSAGGPARWFAPEARRLWWEKTPYFVLAIVATVIVFAAKHQSEAIRESDASGLLAWLVHGVFAPAFYLWKTVLPFGLAPLYQLSGWSLGLGASAVVAASLGVFIKRRQWPLLLAIWTVFLALLLPLPGGDFVGERLLGDDRTYLSCLPWSALLAYATVIEWQTGVARRRTAWFVAPALAVLVLSGLAALTWRQVTFWYNAETLWKHAARAAGSSRAHDKIATLLEAQGRYDQAIAHYRQAAETDPTRWAAHEKAALLLQKQGKIPEAVEHFRSAVRINPEATESRSNLAAGLVNLGELTEAVEHYREVLQRAPERNEARLKVGTILGVQGHLREATELFQQAVKADPADAKALLKLGQVLAAQGYLEQATKYFREVVRIQPEEAEAHESLGRALQEQGKRDEAVKHLREALRILKSSPDSP